LREVASSNEAGQFMVARSFRTLAYLGALPLQAVRDCVWDVSWRKKILSELTVPALEALCDGMAELQMQNAGEWSIALPQFWASLCEEGVGEERRQLLFTLRVLSCLNAGFTSA